MVTSFGSDQKDKIVDTSSENALWLASPLEMGEEFGHSRGAQSRAAAPQHWMEPVDVVQASDKDASCVPSGWGVLGMSHRQEGRGQIQDMLERLYLSTGLETPWYSPGQAGSGGRGESVMGC